MGRGGWSDLKGVCKSRSCMLDVSRARTAHTDQGKSTDLPDLHALERIRKRMGKV